MKSGEHFDVIIIGAGPSGIFCAYELIKEKPELNILMIEKEIVDNFEKLNKSTNEKWNWQKPNSHISIMCPKSHNHFMIK